MSDTPIRPVDLARLIEGEGSKAEQGQALDALISEHADDAPWLVEWRQQRLYMVLGTFVASERARSQRDRAPKITYDGRPMTMTPTISVDAQLRFWLDVSPAQWIVAAQREQEVALGRVMANQPRLAIVAKLLADDDLAALPTMGDVVEALGLDPDDIVLDEAAAS